MDRSYPGPVRNLDIFATSLLPPVTRALPARTEIERLVDATERRRRAALFRRGRAPKPGRRSPTCRGTFPPDPRSGQLVDVWRAQSANLGRERWDCPDNKVHSHRGQSAGSSCPNRCPRDCCTSSNCAAACGCASEEYGSRIARTSSCSSNRAAMDRRPTFLHTSWNAPSIPPNTPISGSHPGTRPGGQTTHRAARDMAAYQLPNFQGDAFTPFLVCCSLIGLAPSGACTLD